MRRQDAAAEGMLLLLEGFAVGALIHSRIGFVGAHQNTVQRTVVFAVAVVSALLNSTFDALVGFAVHNISSFSLRCNLSMS